MKVRALYRICAGCNATLRSLRTTHGHYSPTSTLMFQSIPPPIIRSPN
ncbi:hypothetical protein BN1221_03920c [Brenneria goodwinii]|uniref:Uncharacterized protein n=1 Tax=Brenneria goodwinii TaxID=1109412 RepID=A0A0G4K0B8_9GAMM|nr:hypothetical protein BN1221_03920c [Brenneria goodwinii]